MTTTKTIKLISRKDAKEKLYKDFNVSSLAKEKELVEKIDFTDGIEYEMSIIKATEISANRTTKSVRALAKERGLETPPAEVGVLLRVALSDKKIEEMGLWYIVAMHEPITDSDGDPCLLRSSRYIDGRWLDADYDRPDVRWDDGGGFAFVVPQVGAKESGPKPSSGALPLDLAIEMVKKAGYKVI